MALADNPTTSCPSSTSIRPIENSGLMCPMAGVEVMRIFMGFCSRTNGIDRFFYQRRQSLSMMR
jgi:hypothetical protein